MTAPCLKLWSTLLGFRFRMVRWSRRRREYRWAMPRWLRQVWLQEMTGPQLRRPMETNSRPFTVQVGSYECLQPPWTQDVKSLCQNDSHWTSAPLCSNQITVSRSWKLLHPQLNAGQSNPGQVRQDWQSALLFDWGNKKHITVLFPTCASRNPWTCRAAARLEIVLPATIGSKWFGTNVYNTYITVLGTWTYIQCWKVEKERSSEIGEI